MAAQPLIAYQALILSVLPVCTGAWIIAHRYRRRMRHLMRAPQAEKSALPAAGAPPVQSPPPTRVTLADNRAAGMRLTALLMVLSCLMAVTSACIWCLLMPRHDMA